MIRKFWICLLILSIFGILADRGLVSRAAVGLDQDSSTVSIKLPFVFRSYVQGPGSVSGTVFDATSADRPPLDNVTVCYLDECAVTGSDGTYLIEDLPDGLRRLSAAREEYYPTSEDVLIRPFESAKQDFALTPLSEISDVFMRVLLTWSSVQTWPPDDTNNDLDAHLWLEAPDPPTHISFSDKGDCTTFPNACLEVDYKKGYGPETLAIRQLQSTVYYYGVLNYYAGYPGVPKLTDSQAKVRLYLEDGTVMEYNVPAAGEGDFWYVFQLVSDGNTATVVEKNCITFYDLSPPVCPSE